MERVQATDKGHSCCNVNMNVCAQVMEPASAQLSAAIYSLIAALLGRRHDGPFLLWCVYNLSFARWGLEGTALHSCFTLGNHNLLAFQYMLTSLICLAMWQPPSIPSLHTDHPLRASPACKPLGFG